MFIRLIMLFTIIPIIELYILIALSGYTGIGTTILIVIGTGVIGAYMTKQQSMETYRKIKDELAVGMIPSDGLINGLCILIGGAFLITPGLLTDTVGFALVIPFSRAILVDRLKKYFEKMINKGSITIIK